jgi:acyl dehydratase
MADTSKAGIKLPPITLLVERVKIRELMEAIGDTNPIYRDPECARAEGYRDTPCPPTFITLAFQEFTGFSVHLLKELGIPLARTVHGEEEYEYLQPIYPGDELTIAPVIESVVEKQSRSGGLALVTLQTVVTNQSGLEVMRTRSLIIERK